MPHGTVVVISCHFFHTLPASANNVQLSFLRSEQSQFTTEYRSILSDIILYTIFCLVCFPVSMVSLNFMNRFIGNFIRPQAKMSHCLCVGAAGSRGGVCIVTGRCRTAAYRKSLQYYTAAW